MNNFQNFSQNLSQPPAQNLPPSTDFLFPTHKILKTEDYNIFENIITFTQNLIKPYKHDIKINKYKYKIKVNIYNDLEYLNVCFTIQLFLIKNNKLALEINRRSGCVVTFYNDFYNYLINLDL